MPALPISPHLRRAGATRDRGATVIEFALVLPLLLTLVLGMITAGIAFDRGQSLTHGAREASRFGATLPTTAGMTSWLDAVAVSARSNSVGNVDPSAPNRYLCVALVGTAPAGTRIETSAGVTYGSGECFADGLGPSPRVQVVTGRDVEFDALVLRRTITLRKQAVTVYEATP